MQASGFLEVIAELSVAFAGFSGLAGAFRGTLDQSSAQRTELRILVEYAFILMANALFPLLFWNLGASEPNAWRLASFAGGALSALYYLVRVRTLLAETTEGVRGTYYTTMVLDWTRIVALLANAFDVFPWPPQVIVLVMLAYTLLGATGSFLRFIAPLWGESPSD